MWLAKGQHTKYLGMPIRSRVGREVQEEWAVNQVKKQLMEWACKQLTCRQNINRKSSYPSFYVVLGFVSKHFREAYEEF